MYAEEAGVFAEAGEVAALLAFELDAEQVDDVGFGEGVLEVVADADADLLEFARDERGGSGERDVRAELDELNDTLDKTGDIYKFYGCRNNLGRVIHIRKNLESVVGNRHNAYIRVYCAERIVGRLGACLGQ